MREEAYVRLSAAQVSRSLAVNATQLFGGLLQQGLFGLLGGQLLGQLIASTVLAWQTWKQQGAFLRRVGSVASMLRAARAYSRFPLFSSPQCLLNAISQNIPAFLFMHAYGV